MTTFALPQKYDQLNLDEISCHDSPVIELHDHLGGFNQYGENSLLCLLDQHAKSKNKIYNIRYHQVLDHWILKNYPNLKIIFSAEFQQQKNFLEFAEYKTHPTINFKNFICSFNGSPHVSRKLLTSVIWKFGWFNLETCSKNFSCTTDVIDGHLGDYLDPDRIRVLRKFFIDENNEDFYQSINSFGHVRYDHPQNIYNLENKLTQSFLHVVSETLATSYAPFVTEKSLYSIVTRGLFLCYAQPGWHEHVEKYYGFKKYSKLFDYKFDTVQNPVERLVELVTMLSKFSKLSTHDWHDLYLIEQDTIEYNYDHYFGQDYLKCLAKFE